MAATARGGNDGRTTDRLLRVLLLFAREESLTAARISEAAGIPQSTVYRLLDRLTASGFVRRRPDGYAAGPVAVQFAERYRTGALERTAIGPRLARLSRESGELAAFMVPVGTEALCVDSVEGSRVLRCCYTRGATQPLLRGATAQALLAHLPEARREAVYSAYGLPPGRVRELEAEHAEVRRQAVAVSESALDQGVWGASSPVLDAGGALVGTVTLMAPAAHTAQRRPHYVRLVREAARDLSGGTI
ncbi:IclR family transcriptional regulator [Nocardiopsis potens]|uniref:IclR family transcriptional regulator n=1 Tax=Nocardiopsis potens TaxID=1246458 RepID=UPI00034A81A3|nr:IclR family transcriptional regulator [Nocardiopsis potens]